MRLLTLIAGISAVLSLSACATVDGIGRDLSGGANRVQGWID